MNSSAIPAVKRVIRCISFENCKSLADEALKCKHVQEVNNLLKEWLKEYVDEKTE
jgi:phosphoenolpyruvate-protein kinase (PTS system EI component)